MIESLKLFDFTVFQEASFEFSPGLNVIVGENATGKTHLLKALYSIARGRQALRKGDLDPDFDFSRAFWDKFREVFRVSSNKVLKNRGLLKGGIAKLECAIDGENVELFLDKPEFMGGMSVQKTVSDSLYIPPTVPLSFHYGFTSLYDRREIEFDGTYNDLCLAYGLPELREKHREKVAPFIDALEKTIGGSIIIEEGRPYLLPFKGEKMEINLVAEGWKKLGMFALLIRTGSIHPGSILFWDEPEANLNPRLVKLVVSILSDFARLGVQIFLATHSLFFIKELVLSTHDETVPCRFFGFKFEKKQHIIESGSKIHEITCLAALDEALIQADRELEVAWTRKTP